METEKHYTVMLQGLEQSYFIQSDKSTQMLIEPAWITALMLMKTFEPLVTANFLWEAAMNIDLYIFKW